MVFSFYYYITMNNFFLNRINTVPRSYVRKTLRAAVDPTVISFAGGLPIGKIKPIQLMNKFRHD
jgi:2-aminoadipate transaminase